MSISHRVSAGQPVKRVPAVGVVKPDYILLLRETVVLRRVLGTSHVTVQVHENISLLHQLKGSMPDPVLPDPQPHSPAVIENVGVAPEKLRVQIVVCEEQPFICNVLQARGLLYSLSYVDSLLTNSICGHPVLLTRPLGGAGG